MKLILNQNNVILDATNNLFYICENTNNKTKYATEYPTKSIGVLVNGKMYDYSKNFLNPPYYSVYSIVDVDEVPTDFKPCKYKWDGKFVENSDIIPLTDEEIAKQIPNNVNDIELAIEELYEMIQEGK